MNRSIPLLLALSVLISLPLESSAFSFEVVELTGCETPLPGGGGCFGETITVGVRLENGGGLEVVGIAATVFGYDPSVASFASGETVASVLNQSCVAGVGCFGGVTNLTSSPLSESLGGVSGAYVHFLDAFSVSSTTGDGSNDPGLDSPGLGVPDDSAEFRFRFTIVSPGVTTLTIGFDSTLGDGVFGPGIIDINPPDAGLQVVLSSEDSPYVVPEPTTAVLLACGLMALARSTRRRA